MKVVTLIRLDRMEGEEGHLFTTSIGYEVFSNVRGDISPLIREWLKGKILVGGIGHADEEATKELHLIKAKQPHKFEAEARAKASVR